MSASEFVRIRNEFGATREAIASNARAIDAIGPPTLPDNVVRSFTDELYDVEAVAADSAASIVSLQEQLLESRRLLSVMSDSITALTTQVEKNSLVAGTDQVIGEMNISVLEIITRTTSDLMRVISMPPMGYYNRGDPRKYCTVFLPDPEGRSRNTRMVYMNDHEDTVPYDDYNNPKRKNDHHSIASDANAGDYKTAWYNMTKPGKHWPASHSMQWLTKDQPPAREHCTYPMLRGQPADGQMARQLLNPSRRMWRNDLDGEQVSITVRESTVPKYFSMECALTAEVQHPTEAGLFQHSGTLFEPPAMREFGVVSVELEAEEVHSLTYSEHEDVDDSITRYLIKALSGQVKKGYGKASRAAADWVIDAISGAAAAASVVNWATAYVASEAAEFTISTIAASALTREPVPQKFEFPSVVLDSTGECFSIVRTAPDLETMNSASYSGAYSIGWEWAGFRKTSDVWTNSLIDQDEGKRIAYTSIHHTEMWTPNRTERVEVSVIVDSTQKATRPILTSWSGTRTPLFKWDGLIWRSVVPAPGYPGWFTLA